MIEINAIESRREARQIIYFTIDGQQFSCGDVPAELDTQTKIQKHLDARADEFKLLILRKQYPESDHLRFLKDGETELKAMEAWIEDGHKNKILVGYKDEQETKPIYEYHVIEKGELLYRHPKWVGLMAKIEGSNIAVEMKGLLKEIIK